MKKGCWNCAGNTDGIGCVDCLAGDTPSNWRAVAVQKTNADRIRSMSDEELYDFLYAVYRAGSDDAEAWEYGTRQYSFIWNEEWLRQPAEED